MESNEASGKSSDVETVESEAERELPLPTLIANTCSAMLDAVAVINRIEAQQDAWKIEFIDQARRIAETTKHGLITVGSKLSEQQQRDMVRRSFVAEVAGVLRIPESTAGQLIDDSAVLMSRLPLTLAALREGEISLRHARVVADHVSTLDESNTAALEAAALGYAKRLTVSKFTQKVRILRERIDADSIIERRIKSSRDRRVEFLPARDGMAWLSVYTTAPEATSMYTAIRSAAMRLQNETETRTLTQLSADVCADALAAGLTGGSKAPETSGPDCDTMDALATVPRTAFSSIKPTVFLTVPALTLLGASDEPGDIVGYGPIDPETARKLAGKAKTWYRILTDPETGAVLSLGRKRYKPTKQMRDYLHLVDGTCRWDGCNRNADHCDIDHTGAWEHGGPTDCDNLSHVCPRHHRLKHETTWQPEQLGGGLIKWTSPDGRTYVTEPDILLPVPQKAQPHSQPPPGSHSVSGPPIDPNEPPPF